MNNSVIIIRGLNAPNWTKPFNFFVKLYCWYFGLDPINGNRWFDFKKYLENKNIKVYLYDWVDGVSDDSLKRAGKKLSEFIDNLPEDKLVIFGYSLGAIVGEYGIKYLSRPEKIIRFIAVFSPHKDKRIGIPDTISITNVYSSTDDYLDFANRMLYWGGFKQIQNAENIVLAGLKHSNSNKPELYDQYYKFISN